MYHFQPMTLFYPIVSNAGRTLLPTGRINLTGIQISCTQVLQGSQDLQPSPDLALKVI
jgi:hypothetical protein